MLIKIVAGTYGHRYKLPNGDQSEYVSPITPADPPIEVDEAIAADLIGRGVAVAVGEAAVEEPVEDPVQEETGLEEMTMNELKETASNLGIDVSKLKSKKALIKAIQEADDAPDLDVQDVVE